MSYVKTGPFVDYSGPDVTAVFLNNVETSLTDATSVVVNGRAGIDLTGATDSSAALNTILAAASGCTNLVVLPLNGGRATLRLDSTVTIDVSKAGLTAPYGGLTIDASHNTGTAIKVTASSTAQDNIATAGPKIGPFRLIGPGRATAGTIGILFDAASTAGAVWALTLESVSVEEFETGHQYGNNSFLIDHINATVKGCITNVSAPTGVTNTGERIAYIASQFQNSATCINHANPNGDLYFTNCSFDYFTTSAVTISDGLVVLTGCHVEASIAQTMTWFTHTGGNLQVRGGEILGTGTYSGSTSPQYIVTSTVSATFGQAAVFDGILWIGTRTQTHYLAGGGGNVIVKNSTLTGTTVEAFTCTAAENNILANGDFEQATLIDNWLINADTATITDTGNTSTAVVGSNISAQLSTTISRSSSHSLQMTKVGGAGTAAEVAVAVPITRWSLAGIQGYIARHASMTGTMSVRTSFVTMLGDDVNRRQFGRTQTIVEQGYDLTADLPAADTWYRFYTPTQARRAPAWATHIAVRFLLTSMSAGSLYTDDIVITDA